MARQRVAKEKHNPAIQMMVGLFFGVLITKGIPNTKIAKTIPPINKLKSQKKELILSS
jgi:hypothetical protein